MNGILHWRFEINSKGMTWHNVGLTSCHSTLCKTKQDPCADIALRVYIWRFLYGYQLWQERSNWLIVVMNFRRLVYDLSNLLNLMKWRANSQNYHFFTQKNTLVVSVWHTKDQLFIYRNLALAIMLTTVFAYSFSFTAITNKKFKIVVVSVSGKLSVVSIFERNEAIPL